MKLMSRYLVTWLIVALTVLPWARAQDGAAAFKKEEIEQLVAPIALYPDPLVAQILMASTYPLEIVSAARWSKANPNVKGKDLEGAMQKQTWDPAVKSLTAVPSVLAMMNDKLDWTQKLGDAFLGQQKEIMEAAQRLRAQALKAGNLKSSKEQKVTTEQQGTTTIIKIEPADPQVVYVPTYNPTVVYGPWPYPAYPPYYMYPPAYVYPPGVAFATGVVVGAAIWGNANWNNSSVNVNVNQYNSYNKTNIQNTNYQHSAEHRKNVPYSNSAAAQKYSQASPSQKAQAQQAYRGHTGEALTPSQQQQAQQRAQQQPQTQDRAQQAQQQKGQASQQAAQKPGGGDSGSMQRTGSGDAGGFDGIGQGGQTRDASSRGASSRANSAGSAHASGGGGARAGGGGGGRGGRR